MKLTAPLATILAAGAMIIYYEWLRNNEKKEESPLVKGARMIEEILPNGVIKTGMGDPLPPSAMVPSYYYPSLESAHTPGRIFKV